MKRIMVVLFVAMAFVFSFESITQARDAYREVTRQNWDQKMYGPDGQEVSIYQDRLVRMVDGRQIEPDEKIAGSDGNIYELTPVSQKDHAAAPHSPRTDTGERRRPVTPNYTPQQQNYDVTQSRRPQYPPGAKPGGKFSKGTDGFMYYTEPGSHRASFRFRSDDGFDVRNKSHQSVEKPVRIPSVQPKEGQERRCASNGKLIPMPPATATVRLSRGETVESLMREYAPKANLKKVMKNNNLSKESSRHMPESFPVKFTEKELDPKYQDALPRLKRAYEELAELRAQLAKEREITAAQRERMAELENYIKKEGERLSALKEEMRSEMSAKLEEIRKDFQKPPKEKESVKKQGLPSPDNAAPVVSAIPEEVIDSFSMKDVENAYQFLKNLVK